MLAECYERTKKLLEDHRAQLDALVSALLIHETLSRKEFLAVMAGEELPPPESTAADKPQPAPDIPPMEEKPAVVPPEKPEIPEGIFQPDIRGGDHAG